MKLYLFKRINPQDGSYDDAGLDGAVVRAESGEQARNLVLCALQRRLENAKKYPLCDYAIEERDLENWQDPKRVSCEEIGIAAEGQAPAILMEDIWDEDH